MRIGLISVICLNLVACGGDEGDSSFGSVDTTDPSKFCRAGATTVCEKLFSCLTQKERDDRGIEATIPECQRSFESSCEDSVDDCIDAEHGYASTPAGDCLSEMASATCRDAGDPWFDAPSCAKICERTAGRFKMKWRFEPFYVCSQLRISTVSLVTRLGSKQFVDTFPCDDGAGTTDLLPVGKYTIRVEMHDAQGTRLWATDRAADDIDAAFVDLGELVVPVSQ